MKIKSVNNKIELYLYEGLLWEVSYNYHGHPDGVTARCPSQRCHCTLKVVRDPVSCEQKYVCPKCNFSLLPKKPISELHEDIFPVLESLDYKDADIINIDGELIRVQREEEKDSDYWVDVKISKNRKGQSQLMVMAGSKKDKDKVQLFLDPQNERLSFDQNNFHPREMFTKVTATFKNTESKIEVKDDSEDES